MKPEKLNNEELIKKVTYPTYEEQVKGIRKDALNQYIAQCRSTRSELAAVKIRTIHS